MLSFGTAVSINNLLALRAFHTFIFNYSFHEKPTWLEKRWLPRLRAWIEKKAVAVMNELLNDETTKSTSVALNDVSSDFFTILYIVRHPELVIELQTGKDLFMLMAQMALEFEKVKKPRENISHEPR